MKKVTKFFMAALLAGMCSFGYAQDYLMQPKADENVLGTITVTQCFKRDYPNQSASGAGKLYDWYDALLKKAKQEYPGKNVDIRGMKTDYSYTNKNGLWYMGPASGQVVWIMSKEDQIDENLSQAIDKALYNVREGSRIALDNVSTPKSQDRESIKDKIIDLLLVLLR